MMRGLLLAVVCLVAACSFLSPGKSGGRECRSYCNDRVTECLRECDQIALVRLPAKAPF